MDVVIKNFEDWLIGSSFSFKFNKISLGLDKIDVLVVINSLAIVMILLMAININSLDFYILNVVITSFFIVILFIPLVLHYFKKIILSKVFFILACYTIVVVSALIYGSNLHFQYFLMVIISLPLMFFDREIGNYKWLLVFISLPLSFYQEWHFIYYEPILRIADSLVYWMRLFNDIILFITILLILSIYTNKNYVQYRKIIENNLKLKQNNIELNQFAHIISHDLKVPLRMINSLTDIIVHQHQDNLNDEQIENFELIKSSAKKMNHLIVSVLEYSKAGRDGLEYSHFNSKALFQESLAVLNPPKNLEVILPSKEINLMSSYTQLHQVIVNLVSNAIKYHNKKDGFVKLGMKEISKNLLQFSVQDNGPGIKKHFHNKLLQIFQTANINIQIESTGIGLAIVKKLVEQNGGKLSFDSIYGSGSTFTFTWPKNAKECI